MQWLRKWLFGEGPRPACSRGRIVRSCRPRLEALESRDLPSRIEFPADAGVLDVRNFGATPSDGQDDTATIQSAVNYANSHRPQTVYFPDGQYDVSSQLNLSGFKRVVLQGQSRDGTVIKFNDNDSSAGVGANYPVITFYEGTSSSAVSFRNAVRDLTIDIGAGNPGASGLRFMAHNQGVVENVLIRSSDPGRAGLRGLDMPKAWPGPLLVKNVEVRGFDYGIMVMQQQYSVTLENITLSNQRVAGLQNQGNYLSIRRLTSTNSVRAINNTNLGGGQGVVVVLDSSFVGGSSSESAIVSATGCWVFARNVSSAGYGHTINDRGTFRIGTVTEYHTGSTFSLFSSPQVTLNLPVLETPALPWQPLSDWQKVDGSASNDRAAIQAAIDSGKKVIYFPRSYTWGGTGTLFVRGNVERIIGLENLLGNGFTWQIDAGISSTVIFERFENLGAITVNSNRNVVVKDVMGVSASNSFAGGQLFLEDVVGSGLTLNPGLRVWARQYNTEAKDAAAYNIRNYGGDLWVLGLKTEGPKTVIETTSGGRTELLGGFLYPSGSAGTDPAFISTESSQSLIYFNNAYSSGEVYATQVRETRGGVTKTLLKGSLPGKNQGKIVPLFVGSQETNRAITATSASFSQSGFEPGKTIDNNLTTRWTADGDGQWIQYDLGSVRTVSAVNIAWYSGTTRRYTFDVLVSVDGINWTTVLAGTDSSGLTSGFESCNFTNTAGRYVRLVGHGNTQNEFISLHETDVFGF